MALDYQNSQFKIMQTMLGQLIFENTALDLSCRTMPKGSIYLPYKGADTAFCFCRAVSVAHRHT